jgi:hypothetical protein
LSDENEMIQRGTSIKLKIFIKLKETNCGGARHSKAVRDTDE